MTSTTRAPSTAALWTGRVLTALPILAMLASAAMKISQQPRMLEQLAKFGYTPSTIFAIGFVELAVVALYAVPRTSIFGAVLLTAYLGGATATHVRIGEPFVVPVLLGVLAWLGLYLREERLRVLAPFVRRETHA